jgi:hypothetical protein
MQGKMPAIHRCKQDPKPEPKQEAKLAEKQHLLQASLHKGYNHGKSSLR